MGWRDWPIYSPDCQASVRDLLRHGGPLSAYRANKDFGLGPQPGSYAFAAESLAADYHEVPHVVMCSSGTMALYALLTALKEVTPGNPELALPPLTFSATVAAAVAAGWQWAWRDVSAYTGLMLPDWAYPSCPALPVDLFGQQAPRFTLSMVDACQSVGIKPVADHGVWSFQGGKQVPAGEGGAVFTRSSRVATQVREIINHGENFESLRPGLNGRMSEVTACLVYHGLLELNERLARRRVLAQHLSGILSARPEIFTPQLTRHALYRYHIVLPHSADAVADRLHDARVTCQRGYMRPTLDQYEALRVDAPITLPNAHALSRDRLLVFPQLNPCATEEEIDQLGQSILWAVKGLF